MTDKYRAFNFIHSDHQGSVVMVTDSAGQIEQHNSYYPYGEPHRAPEGQPMLYAGKERLAPTAEYDYGARRHFPPALLWYTPDEMAHKFTHLSPYTFCAANPVRNIDPDGKEIIGVQKSDAENMVDDFHEIFQDDIFADFRTLIVQSGKKQNVKSLAKISPEALAGAFDGVSLNEDQQALVEMTVNTINSDSKHFIEYLSPNDNLSAIGENAFLPGYKNGMGEYLTIILNRNNGRLPLWLIINDSGSGATVPTSHGTHSIILNSTEFRPATTGHEIIGHGRSLSLGRNTTQHIDAVQTENLIYRVMGLPYILDGTTHGNKSFINTHSKIPEFR